MEQILTALGLQDKPRIAVLNKVDLLVSSEDEITAFAAEGEDIPPDAVLISASRGWGLDHLQERIAGSLTQP